DRIWLELTSLRAACTKAILQEQQEKEAWRTHCTAAKEERDLARERVKALMGERQRVHDDRPSSHHGLGYLRRSRSSGSITPDSRRSSLSSTTTAAATPTDFYDKIYSPKYSRPATPSPLLSESTLSDDEDDEAVLSELILPELDPPALSPLELTSLNLLPSMLQRTSDGSTLRRSRSAAPILTRLPDSAIKARYVSSHSLPEPKPGFDPTTVPLPESIPTSPADSDVSLLEYQCLPVEDDESQSLFKDYIPSRAHILKVEHYDILFMWKDGELYCRACLLQQSQNPESWVKCSPAIFAEDASWEELISHSWMEHHEEAVRVSQMSPADIRELQKSLAEISNI
ncbi:hypothetical protein DXG03_009260, partial [Asterophora parasitica]